MKKWRVVMNIGGEQLPYSGKIHYTHAEAAKELVEAYTTPHLVGYTFEIVEVSLLAPVTYADDYGALLGR